MKVEAGLGVTTVLAMLTLGACTGPAEAPPERAVLHRGQPWVDNQLMVQPAEGASLAAIAHDLGVSLVRDVGRSGWGAVGGASSDELRGLLGEHPDVRAVSPMGAAFGASEAQLAPERTEPLQWHLDLAEAPIVGTYDVSGTTVAVVGTGVAYENHNEGGPDRNFTTAKALKDIVVGPAWDFVDDDPHANDENGHGTHVATTILGQSSKMDGVAAGATLMPVRVLDENNSGTELDLVEGLWFAIDNDADVVNMSLAFPSGYLPSPALRDALFAAWQEGIVLVAASGNEASEGVSWPAASPFVIAAGASRPLPSGAVLADYSNASTVLDVLAPGGDLSLDDNLDGFPDGVLAETFAAGKPNQHRLWFYAGTSQASAVVSGAATHLLQTGVNPKKLPFALQKGAVAPGLRAVAEDDTTHLLNIAEAERVVTSGTSFPEAVGYHVAALAYLADNGDGTVTPKAQLTVLDRDGFPVTSGVRVFGTIQSNVGGGRFSCEPTGPCGQCTAEGIPVSQLDDNGDPRKLAFGFRVEAIKSGDFRVRPRGALFTSDALDVITAGLRGDIDTEDAVLAFSWETGTDPILGDIVGGFSVTDAPSKGTTPPLAVVFNEEAIADISTTEVVEVEVDGTGVVFLPVGDRVVVTTIEFDPTGLTTPSIAPRLASIDGSGLVNLGFSAFDVLAPQSTGATCDAQAVLLAEDDGLGTFPDGPVGDQLAEGGWVNGAGYPGASAVSTMLDAMPMSDSAQGAVTGAEEL